MHTQPQKPAPRQTCRKADAMSEVPVTSTVVFKSPCDLVLPVSVAGAHICSYEGHLHNSHHLSHVQPP